MEAFTNGNLFSSGFEWVTVGRLERSSSLRKTSPNFNELIPKIAIIERRYLLQTIILGIHVKYLGCKHLIVAGAH